MEELLKVLVAEPERMNALAAVASVVVAICALVVAAVSIILSLRTLNVQKTHNQLSVKPLPFISVADYEDRLWVKLVNNGSGPLIVKMTTIQGNGQTSETLISRMPRLPDGLAWKSFTSGMKDRSLLPGDELFFIDLAGSPTNPAYHTFRNSCRQALAELSITIAFTDIYGNQFEPVVRELDWFARLLTPKKKK